MTLPTTTAQRSDELRAFRPTSNCCAAKHRSQTTNAIEMASSRWLASGQWVGPRQPGTDAIPGGPIRDAEGNPLDYDIEAQTQAVIDNVRLILEASGSSLDRVLDITAFLVDMDRDFKTFNAVYRERIGTIGPTRTTVAVRALPTPIAVELKVVALP